MTKLLVFGSKGFLTIITNLHSIFLDDLKTARASPVSRIGNLSFLESNQIPSSSATHATIPRTENTTLDKTLIEILDSIILMYNTSVHRQLSKVIVMYLTLYLQLK